MSISDDEFDAMTDVEFWEWLSEQIAQDQSTLTEQNHERLRSPISAADHIRMQTASSAIRRETPGGN